MSIIMLYYIAISGRWFFKFEYKILL